MSKDENPSAPWVEMIRDAVDQGYRFVTLVGAGLSVPSGFPLIADLESRYLRYWILRALRLNPFASKDEDLVESRLPIWDPRSGDWPSMAAEVAAIWTGEDRQPEYMPLTKEHLDKVLHLALDKKRQNQDTLPWLSEKLIAQALGHTQDWRMALHFLARVTSSHGQRLDLATPDPSVIDACFRNLLRGCQPGLAHRMLVALCPVLRINIIVSTNFDDLIERAFGAIPSPVTVFDVPEPVPLPSAELVCNQRSLIKINGGSFNLRADYTVDTSDPRDCDTFCGYLRGQTLPQDLELMSEKEAMRDEKVALLVSGVGATEPRTLGLVRRAIAIFDQLKVFWVSFLDEGESVKKKLGIEKNFHHLAHREHGLLFLQIYQACTRALPTSGVPFPGLWQIPMPPQMPCPKKSLQDRVEIYARELVVMIRKELKATDPKPIVVSFKGKNRGAITLCSALFEYPLGGEKPGLNQSARMVWVDLEQVARPVGLFLRLIQLSALLAGEADPASALDYSAFERPGAAEDRGNFRAALRHVLRGYHVRRGKPLIIFVNTQEGAGTYAPLQLEKFDLQSSTGSFDARWSSPEDVQQLVEQVLEINSDRSCGVQFVLLTRETIPDSGQHDRAHESMALLTETLKQKSSSVTPLRLPEPCTEFDEVKVADAAANWIKHAPNEDRSDCAAFVYLLTLFRQVRYPAGILRCANRDHERESQLREDSGSPADHLSPAEFAQFGAKVVSLQKSWLDQLVDLKVIRWQTGGLIWMSSTIKPLLQAKADLHFQGDPAWPARKLHLESLVARHYGRLLLSSLDPLAAVESIHHALHAVGKILEAAKDLEKPVWAQIEVTLEHARLVLSIASPLFVRRVSEQFSDAALVHLARWAEAVWEAFSKFTVPEAFKLRDIVRAIYWEVAEVRATTYLKEAEYSKVAEVTKELKAIEMTDLWRGQTNHQKSLDLIAGAALLSQRRDEEAKAVFAKLWEYIASDEDPFNEQPGKKFPWAKRERRSGKSAAQLWRIDVARVDFEAIRFAVRLCWWCSVWYLNHGHVELLFRNEVPHAGHQEAVDLRIQGLESALWFADFALELLRSAPHAFGGFVVEENIRLRTHAALCHSYLADLRAEDLRHLPNSRSLMERSQMLLADASAYVDEFPVHQTGVNRAIINLRRAEVSLVNVHAVEWFNRLRSIIFEFGRDNKPTSPRESFARLVQGLNDPHQKRESSENFVEACSVMDPVTQVDWKRIHGLLHDALIRLDRAEAELVQNPKSRWWWWILCVLKTRLGEYYNVLRVAITVSAKRRPHSHNGANQSRFVPFRVKEYYASGVFSDVGIKLIRDPIRLARILSSQEALLYAQVLIANLDDENSGTEWLQIRTSRLLRLVGKARASMNESANDRLKRYIETVCLRVEKAAEVVRTWTGHLAG